MPKRKRKKRGIFDIFDFGEEDSLFGGESGGSSGYSISMTYEAGEPVVRVKTSGDVNVAELRRDIERRYPGARIEGLEKKPLIRVVDEEEKPKKKSSKSSKSPKAMFRPKMS